MANQLNKLYSYLLHIINIALTTTISFLIEDRLNYFFLNIVYFLVVWFVLMSVSKIKAKVFIFPVIIGIFTLLMYTQLLREKSVAAMYFTVLLGSSTMIEIVRHKAQFKL
jgi:hypothetical protein